MNLAYINGQFMPLAEVRISALDRGFLFGDGVYEAIPFYNGKGFGETEHLARLQESLNSLEIICPLSTKDWRKIFQRLLASQTEKYNIIYLQITRGVMTERAHIYPSPRVQPTIFAFIRAFTPGRLSQGINAITLEDIRWRDCYIKSLNLLPNCMAGELAHRHNANEAILYRNDKVTEGSSSNIFVIKDNKVSTPPLSPNILSGISRIMTLKILKKQNLPYVESAITLTELQNADEIWITSSTREIAPVLKLDNNVIGDGKPGPIWQTVYQEYVAQTQA